MRGFITDCDGAMYSIAALRSDPTAEAKLMRNGTMELVTDNGDVLRWQDITDSMHLTLRQKKPPDRVVARDDNFSIVSYLRQKQNRTELWKNGSRSTLPAMVAMTWSPEEKLCRRENTVFVNGHVRKYPPTPPSQKALWGLVGEEITENLGGITAYCEWSNQLYCGGSESGSVRAVSLDNISFKNDPSGKQTAFAPPDGVKCLSTTIAEAQLLDLHPLSDSEICAVANTNCTEIYLLKRARAVTLPIGTCIASTVQPGTTNLILGTHNGVVNFSLDGRRSSTYKRVKTKRPVTAVLSEPEGGVTYVGQRGGTLAHLDWREGKFTNYYNTTKAERSTTTALAMIDTHPNVLAARYTDGSLKLWDIRNTTRHMCDLIPSSVGFHKSATVKSWSGQLISNSRDSLLLHSLNSATPVSAIVIPDDIQSLAVIPLQQQRLQPSIWVGFDDHVFAVCNPSTH
eukprot:TRINITY_DN18770_c0_g1_i1.p1 TRINITY_DN18770_c0_g1~~TRINITY_DN18770_c0_g1_i1.p1  ORF type:complete len:475 (+),score=67.14 TRINITY_DN18770_c0_g1_i1:58-1425(+)